MAENIRETTAPDTAADAIALAGDITIAWLQNPNVHPAAQDVPAFLKSMHAAIAELGSEATPQTEAPTYEPAVSVRSSVKPDHLVSLIDGRKFKSLKRHLSTNGLTPDEYRARYGLKSDYPMVAESYAAERREIAKKLGLGRKPAAAPDAAAQVVDAAPESTPAKPKRAARAANAETVSAPVAPVIDADAPVAAADKPKRGRKGKVEVVLDDVTAPVAKSVTAPVAEPVIEPVIAPAADSPKRGRKPKAAAQRAVTTAAPTPTAAPGKAKRMARQPAAVVSEGSEATPEIAAPVKAKRGVSKPKASDKVAGKTAGKSAAKPVAKPEPKPARWVRPEV